MEFSRQIYCRRVSRAFNPVSPISAAAAAAASRRRLHLLSLKPMKTTQSNFAWPPPTTATRRSVSLRAGSASRHRSTGDARTQLDPPLPSVRPCSYISSRRGPAVVLRQRTMLFRCRRWKTVAARPSCADRRRRHVANSRRQSQSRRRRRRCQHRR